MPDQYRRSILARQHPRDRFHGLGQGRQRILYGSGIEPHGLQPRDDWRPAGTVGEEAVGKNDIARCVLRQASTRSGQDDRAG